MANKKYTEEERNFIWTFDKLALLKARFPTEGASPSLMYDLGCPSLREIRRKARSLYLRRIRKFEERQCSRRGCGKIATVGNLCDYHWCMKKLRDARVISQDDEVICKQMMQKLREQGMKCAYTGWELYPGINASIDHITPLASGGLNLVENLEWVDERVNFAKQQLLRQDFCKLLIDGAIFSSLENRHLNEEGIHYMINTFNKLGYKDIAEVISKYAKSYNRD